MLTPPPRIPSPKKQVTVRLDADILDWLQDQGPGYQSRLNDILRRAMLSAARQRSAAPDAQSIR